MCVCVCVRGRVRVRIRIRRMEPDVNEEETVESSNACQYDNE